MDYLARVKETPPPREDFERLRRVKYADFVQSFDSTDEIGNEFLYHLFVDIDLFDVGDVFASITYEEVVALLQEFFCEDYAVMATIYPKDEGEDDGNEN